MFKKLLWFIAIALVAAAAVLVVKPGWDHQEGLELWHSIFKWAVPGTLAAAIFAELAETWFEDRGNRHLAERLKHIAFGFLAALVFAETIAQVYSDRAEVLEKLRLERRYGPRRLTAEQRAALAVALNDVAPIRLDVSIVMGDPEAKAYWQELRPVLLGRGLTFSSEGDAVFMGTVTGLNVQFNPGNLGNAPQDTEVRVPRLAVPWEVMALDRALGQAGIPHEVRLGGGPGTVSLVVGSKPALTE